MADFEPIAVNTTAEKLEKIANMDVLTGKVETENDNALVSATSLLKTLAENVDLNNYYTKSETDALVNGSIKIWQPNTEYKKYDVVIGDISYDGFYYFQAILTCQRNHTSESELHEDMWLNLYEDIRSGMWGVKPFISREAETDSKGNYFPDHYATKEEVGNIETALDNIIAIQNQLMGGGA